MKEKDNVCACGKGFSGTSARSNLSRHGKTCEIYQERKINNQPLNVYNVTINNNITNNVNNNVDIVELSGEIIEKMKKVFVEKKPTKKIEYSYDYIYIVREAKYIPDDLPIYKVGRTFRKPNKRLAEYPPGSEVYLLVKSAHSKRDETIMLELFKNTFEPRTDIGTEYFGGDVIEMEKIVMGVVWKV